MVMMDITLETTQERQILTLHATRIDAAGAIAFKDDVLAVLDARSKGFILDLSQIEFIDSSGLGAIVSILKSRPSTMTMTLVGLSSGVERVFRLKRMDRVFDIQPNIKDALQAMDHQTSPVAT
jgi:anti-sigma B factor antagonist